MILCQHLWNNLSFEHFYIRKLHAGRLIVYSYTRCSITLSVKFLVELENSFIENYTTKNIIDAKEFFIGKLYHMNMCAAVNFSCFLQVIENKIPENLFNNVFRSDVVLFSFHLFLQISVKSMFIWFFKKWKVSRDD